MEELQLIEYIETAIEFFDESFVPDSDFMETLDYHKIRIMVSGKSNNEFKIELELDSENMLYEFSELEELDYDLIFDEFINLI